MKHLIFTIPCLLFLILMNHQLKANDCLVPTLVNICPNQSIINEDLNAIGTGDNVSPWAGPSGFRFFDTNDIFYEVTISQAPSATTPPTSIRLTIANISSGSLNVLLTSSPPCNGLYTELYNFSAADCQQSYDFAIPGAGTYYFAVEGSASYDIRFSGSTGTAPSTGSVGCDLGFWDFEDVSSCGLTPFKSTVPYFELCLNGAVLNTNQLLTYNLASSNQICIRSNFKNLTGGESVKSIDFNFGPALTATPTQSSCSSSIPLSPFGTIPAQQGGSGDWQVSGFTNPPSDPAYLPAGAIVTNRISWIFDSGSSRGDASGCDYTCSTYEFCFDIVATNNNPEDTRIVGVFYPDGYSTPSVAPGTPISTNCHDNTCMCDPAACFALAQGNTNSAPRTIDFEDPALPVELLYFKGKISKGNTLLSWETASELNNSHFELEHRTDDSKFERIATILGNGTTSKPNNYNYSDQQVSRGTHYYRLKQVDFDNAYEYSEIISVDQFFDESSVQLNYTLNSDIIELNFENIEHHNKIQIELYHLSGQLIKRINPSSTNSIPIDISDFTNGHYFARIHYNNTIITKRFVKVK